MATIGKLAPRSYEEFQPSFEWIQEEGSEILRVPLPGFNKDDIKVQMDTLGNLRVSGESHVGTAGNRWRRFRKDFRVPENCNAREISAKLEDDVLDIVLPRLVARPRQQQSQPTVLPPQEPAPSPRREVTTKPRVGDDQDHNIRSRKESTPTSNIGATPLRAKPIVDTISAAAAAAQAKERTAEPRAGQPILGAGLGKNLQAMEVPEKDVKSTNATADAADKLADAPRRRKEESSAAAAEYAATGGIKDDGAAAVKPKLGASLSFNKPNQQLLLNVGVAVGVLVGLTSYLAYNLGKSIGTECRCH